MTRAEGLWAAAAIAGALLACWYGAFPGWADTPADFTGYYTGGVLYLGAGPSLDPGELYDYRAFQERAVLAGVPHPASFMHQTPFVAAFFSPLALFEWDTARRIWLLANTALMGWIAWRLCRGFDGPRWMPAALFFASGAALWTHLANGQLYLVCIALTVLSWRQEDDGPRVRWAREGALALCLALKPLFLVVWACRIVGPHGYVHAGFVALFAVVGLQLFTDPLLLGAVTVSLIVIQRIRARIDTVPDLLRAAPAPVAAALLCFLAAPEAALTFAEGATLAPAGSLDPAQVTFGALRSLAVAGAEGSVLGTAAALANGLLMFAVPVGLLFRAADLDRPERAQYLLGAALIAVVAASPIAVSYHAVALTAGVAVLASLERVRRHPAFAAGAMLILLTANRAMLPVPSSEFVIEHPVLGSWRTYAMGLGIAALMVAIPNARTWLVRANPAIVTGCLAVTALVTVAGSEAERREAIEAIQFQDHTPLVSLAAGPDGAPVLSLLGFASDGADAVIEGGGLVSNWARPHVLTLIAVRPHGGGHSAVARLVDRNGVWLVTVPWREGKVTLPAGPAPGAPAAGDAIAAAPGARIPWPPGFSPDDAGESWRIGPWQPRFAVAKTDGSRLVATTDDMPFGLRRLVNEPGP